VKIFTDRVYVTEILLDYFFEFRKINIWVSYSILLYFSSANIKKYELSKDENKK
jgi:hypothetical protein